MSENKSKEKLLNQLNELGICTSNHKRSDFGKKRGPNSKKRSDIGHPRISSRKPKDLYIVYKSLRNKLLNKESDNFKLSVDINNIWIPQEPYATSKSQEYFVVTHGVRVNRTIKYKYHKGIDLEEYRFNAIQDKALEFPDDKIPYDLSKEVKYYDIKWYQLFEKLYHIPIDQVRLWSYKKWRLAYNAIYGPTIKLTEEYMFCYNDKIAINKEYMNKLIEEIKDSKEYINYKAYELAKLSTQMSIPIMQELMSDDAYKDLSISKLKKIVDERLDKEKLNEQLAKSLSEFINEKLKSKGVEVL